MQDDMKKQVNILISTYNGEKYIKAQIDSILAQTYKNIKIYVRDDGSTDQTIQILKEYESKGDIILFTSTNIGYGKSFLKLLNDTKEGCFWAFSDQDDIWHEKKISYAVDWFDKQDPSLPLLFHSAYDLVNEDMSKVIGCRLPPRKAYQFHNAITDCIYQGFSLVVNNILRDLVLKCDINRLTSHDWIVTLIVAEFGLAKFDERIACRHRRHEESISGMSLNNRLDWFKSTLKGDSDIKSTAKEFVRIFGDERDDPNMRVVRWFTHDKYSFIDTMKKVFYPKRWRSTLSSELSIRFLMLIGKI